ncbi:MAG: lysylphosphatidylglycerol synthase transmembrane domain-containing protein [Acidimicrobiales bacterium]
MDVEAAGDARVEDELAELTAGVAPARRHLVLGLRITVSVVMLFVLFWRMPHIEWAALVPEWSAQTGVLLAGAAALTLVGLVLSAVRWRAVLSALGHDAPLSHLLSHVLAGQFVSNVLPTTIGGDVLRVSRLAKETDESAASFASVVLERLTGWLVLPIITFVGLILNPGLRDLGAATQVAVAIAAGTLVGLVLLLVGVASRRFGRVGGHSGWRRFAGALNLGLDRMRRHPGAAANVVIVGFAYQLVLVLAALLAAKAVGIGDGVGPTALLAFFPAVLIAQVLPISISGLGVREGAFILFLHPLGIRDEQAIALGLLLYLLNLVVSLLGAPAFAVGGRGAGPAAAH